MLFQVLALLSVSFSVLQQINSDAELIIKNVFIWFSNCEIISLITELYRSYFEILLHSASCFPLLERLGIT